MLVKTFQEAGVETKGILVDDRYFTTLAFVTLDESGDREFSFARKPGADTMLTAEELPGDLVTETKIFHFGTLSMTGEPARSATKEAVRMAREAGAMITFDPNLRRPLWSSMDLAREQMLWGLRHADMVKIGQDELEFIFEGQDFKESARMLVEEFGVKLVFATMGKEGCYFINRRGGWAGAYLPGSENHRHHRRRGYFGGSAVYQVFASGAAPEQLTPEQLTGIVRFANAAASLSTTKHGGFPAFRRRRMWKHSCRRKRVT